MAAGVPYKVCLVHKYQTNLFAGDFSHGTFFEGSITVPSLEAARAIEQRFLNEGTIVLYEAARRYLSREIVTEETTLHFRDDEAKNFNSVVYTRGKHPFGDGYTHLEPDGYRRYYWLQIAPDGPDIEILHTNAPDSPRGGCIQS